MSLMLERDAPLSNHTVKLENGRTISFTAYRGDLVGRYMSGNKILKLTPNIQKYLNETDGQIAISTFGGSSSNSLRAFSALARFLRLDAIAYIRKSPKNYHVPLATLLAKRGVTVIELNPEEFKQREDSAFLEKLKQRYGEQYILPEGGSTGCAVNFIAHKFQKNRNNFSHVYVPVGLAGTLAGISLGVGPNTQVIGVSAVKSDPSLPIRARKAFSDAGQINPENWRISYQYHFGGFGRTTSELEDFIGTFEEQTGILLNPTYTAKSAYAMCHANDHKPNDQILWVNTYNPH
jgi:1-aminocyclopropane-1-carboxylate deaminase